MPIVERSTYRAPVFFSNAHVQTIFPSVFRRVSGVTYRRERIHTPDGDFLDLDWSGADSTKVAIILHGLEGNSERAYMRGMVRAFNRAGWNAVAVNFRGCSGECNRKLRFYHSGDTTDLHTVVTHVVGKADYSELALVGISLGGNVILKYLGEQGDEMHPSISRAVAFSVPCDLTAGSIHLNRTSNRLYLKRFLRMLHDKIRMKMEIMPDRIDDRNYRSIKSFKEFDDRYTAPMNGFRDAHDYWERASCKPFLPNIRIPTLLVSAADDPFLPHPCYPLEEAKANPNFLLEIPSKGGHAGFVTFNAHGEYWSESRAVEFCSGMSGSCQPDA